MTSSALPAPSRITGTRRTFLAALALLGLLAWTPRAGAQGTDSTGAQLLHAGDILKIDVWRKPELSGQFEVDLDGRLKHPIYQDVSLVNADLPQIVSRIRTFLTRFESDPQFVVEPLLRVAIIGEVRQPGIFRLPRETTIAQAVASAGGPTDQANTDEAMLIRNGQRIRIDPRGANDTVVNGRIRSGDQIVLERRVNLLRDYIAPSASVMAAIGVLINIIRK